MSKSAELELTRLRQGLYRFFAVAFLPPEQEQIEQLAMAADLLEDLGVDTLAFDQAWKEMIRWLRTPVDVDSLAAQYVHLFESGSDGALCPPVESFYLSSPLQGGTALVTADLEADFNRLGLGVAGRSEQGVDHISPQLELMALLCAQEATAAECGDLESVSTWNHEQLRFSDSRLSRWVPLFATRIPAVATHGFYRVLVGAVHAFVDHDRELLHALERRERTGHRA